MRRRVHRSDSNQKEITDALEQLPGVSFFVASNVGDGFPDLVVGYRGVNYLFEIKSSAKKKLTKAQKVFFQQWYGTVYRVDSFDEIFSIINEQKKNRAVNESQPGNNTNNKHKNKNHSSSSSSSSSISEAAL